MEKPLMIVIEEAKTKLFSAFNDIAKETKLPPFLLESVVVDLLSDIRQNKYINLISMINSEGGEKLE